MITKLSGKWRRSVNCLQGLCERIFFEVWEKFKLKNFHAEEFRIFSLLLFFFVLALIDSASILIPRNKITPTWAILWLLFAGFNISAYLADLWPILNVKLSPFCFFRYLQNIFAFISILRVSFRAHRDKYFDIQDDDEEYHFIWLFWIPFSVFIFFHCQTSFEPHEHSASPWDLL